MYINSNMTPREAFTFYGSLPDDWIEYLIEEQEANYSLDEVSPHIEEAMAQYPAEDFIEAEGIFDDLRTLARHVKGDNKLAVLVLLEKLDALQLTISRQAEYGKDELRKAHSITEFIEVK